MVDKSSGFTSYERALGHVNHPAIVIATLFGFLFLSDLCVIGLPPVLDELLSLWIARQGAIYNVSPRAMLRHLVPEARSLKCADDYLADKQGKLLAHILR
jgi:hypothetical protein